MTVHDERFSPGMIKIIEQVQKLLNHAAKTQNQEEAASYSAKANEMLAKYNLDASTVERAQGAAEGKREQAKVRGGFYQYQRDLWKAVADLNFCMYWTQTYFEEKTVYDKQFDGSWKKVTRPYQQKRHMLIGKIVNTTATKILAQYLEDTIERIVREQIKTDPLTKFSKWAVSFREGMVDTVVEKITERRKAVLEKERVDASKKAKAAREKGSDGVSISRELALADLAQSERDANVDFIKGEGYSARKRQQAAEDAAAEAEAEAEYTRWAKAHPEEARKAEEERQKESDKYWARRRGGRYSTGAGEKQVDQSAYYSGRRAAEKVGLDPQMGNPIAGLIGKGKK